MPDLYLPLVSVSASMSMFEAKSSVCIKCVFKLNSLDFLGRVILKEREVLQSLPQSWLWRDQWRHLCLFLMVEIFPDKDMEAVTDLKQMDARPNSLLSIVINLTPRTSKQIASCHLLNVEEWLQQNSTKY